MASVLLAAPALAQSHDDLLDALKTDEMLAIMREEGVGYGDELALDLFASGQNPRWSALVSDLYNTDAMRQVVSETFSETLAEPNIAPLLDYFAHGDGAYVVTLELAARRAMVDETVEDIARNAYQSALADDDPRLVLIDRFVAANDLVEANVEGALNASYQFYRGLVEGGAFRMTEEDILADVWGQEEETRIDTREWLYGFLLLAYGPLDDAELEGYVEMSESARGQALNRALFAGFNAMYDKISYGLGLAAAQQMQGQDL
ncbi:hypothetical protein J1C49_04525 [Cognatishimia sp. F0-27]|nr:hypothetical protein [Cognatishimia sp. F0-27]